MELTQTFSFEDWTIKYALLGPEQAPDQASQTLKTVLFVHGTPWSSVTFVPLAKAILAQNGNRVLLYDLPGYGKSQGYAKSPTTSTPAEEGEKIRFEGDTSVKFQALALSKLLEHLQLDGKDGREAPAVVAHDIAGTIALRCLLMHECRFRSLLLMDTNTVLPWGDGFYKLARANAEVFCALPFATYEAVLRSVIRSACYNPEKLRGGWEDELAKPWLIPSGSGDTATEESVQQSFVRQIAQANDADVAEMLDADMYRTVACPTKILWGEEDKWIPREKMERLAEMLKHCLRGFVGIPEAGHLIMIDQPERVAIEVSSWLSSY